MQQPQQQPKQEAMQQPQQQPIQEAMQQAMEQGRSNARPSIGRRVLLSVMAALFVALSIPTGVIQASEEEKEKKEAPEGEEATGSQYFQITPSFVVNYGIAREGKLKYVRADVTLRVADGAATKQLEYHAPWVRNQLLMLLARQEEADLVTPAGRDKIRKVALTDLRAFLKKETGKPCIEDLFFTNFLVQR